MKISKKFVKNLWWALPIAFIVIRYGGEILLAAAFGFPDEAQTIELVKKYDHPIMCKLLWLPPPILPGKTEEDVENRCFSTAAVYFDDKEVCNYIQTSWRRDMCKSVWLTCGEIETESIRLDCFRDRAEAGQLNVDDCIAEANVANQGACFLGLTLKTNDATYCDLIPKKSDAYSSQITCYTYLAAIFKESIYCEKIYDEVKGSDKEIVENCHLRVELEK